jgi:hypothetical protein
VVPGPDELVRRTESAREAAFHLLCHSATLRAELTVTDLRPRQFLPQVESSLAELAGR